MKEPKRIPLTDNPRHKEPKRIPLDSDTDLWDRYDTQHDPPIFAKDNEDHKQNNSSCLQQLESDKTH